MQLTARIVFMQKCFLSARQPLVHAQRSVHWQEAVWGIFLRQINTVPNVRNSLIYSDIQCQHSWHNTFSTCRSRKCTRVQFSYKKCYIHFFQTENTSYHSFWLWMEKTFIFKTWFPTFFFFFCLMYPYNRWATDAFELILKWKLFSTINCIKVDIVTSVSSYKE